MNEAAVCWMKDDPGRRARRGRPVVQEGKVKQTHTSTCVLRKVRVLLCNRPVVSAGSKLLRRKAVFWSVCKSGVRHHALPGYIQHG